MADKKDLYYGMGAVNMYATAFNKGEICGVLTIYHSRLGTFVIFTASLSSLQGIHTFSTTYPLVLEIQGWLYWIFTRQNSSFLLGSKPCWDSRQWMCRYTSMHGSSSGSITPKCISDIDCYLFINHLLTQWWYKEWSSLVSTKVRTIKLLVIPWYFPSHCKYTVWKSLGSVTNWPL